MKQITYLLTFFILTGCRQMNTEQHSNTPKDAVADGVADSTISGNNGIVKQTIADKVKTAAFKKQSLSEFEKATLYKLTDTIRADFNGDGIIDKAYFKKATNNSGIIIEHGQTNEVVKLGFGKPFAHMTAFDWVDYWGLVEDKQASETTFTENGDVLGSKDVQLQNPSIVLGADEVGGGLVTYLNGKYVWIHQTC